jgi:glycosyltransferase involved in cell wall biosynthesis
VASALTGQLIEFGTRHGFATIGLEAKRVNSHAIRFYEKRGFAITGTRGDSVVMTHCLTKGPLMPMVSICCVTYNHEHFIRAAIDSFLMQETSFPIEIIIHDDASTDETSEIVAGYAAQTPDVFVSIRQPVNLYSQGVRGMTYRFMLPRTRGKYVALCEGDDYWTDPRKLQKQVDFLEAHPDFSGTFHLTQQTMFDGKPGRRFGERTPSVMTTADTFSTLSPFHTSSLVFRNGVKEWPAWLGNVVSGDMAMFSIISSLGPLKKFPEVMSVYRKHPGGITSSAQVMDTYHQKRIELMHYLNEFHGHRFDAEAKQVIQAHERELAIEQQRR